MRNAETRTTRGLDRVDPEGTFPIAVVAELIASLGGGIDIAEELRRAGIPPALVSDDRARVTIPQAASLIRRLWRITGDEIIGLGEDPVLSGTFRMFAIGLVHTRDLFAALDRFCEFSGLIAAVPTAQVEEHDEGAVRVTLDLHGTSLDDTLLAGMLLVIIQRFSSWLVSRRIDATLVELPGDEPAERSHFDIAFGAPLRFGARVPALWFDSGLLVAPVTQDEDTLGAYLQQCPEVWLSRRDFGTTTGDRVRRILGRLAVADWPAQEDLAQSLAMSPQTLRRRLRDQGTSTVQIKDEIRRDRAITSLSGAQESVGDLAARLGFSEPSAFHRAFRRWTGQAPGAYRTSLRE